VRVVEATGRSFIRRTLGRFDLIVLSLSDSHKVVTSGAYSLSENYTYTVEAFVEYLAHLREDGLLVVHRWLQLPPTESVKAGAIALTALRKAGVPHPEESLIVIRSWSTALILVKKGGFTAEEIEAVKEFCQGKFDLVYYPGIKEDEANRQNVFPEPYYYQAFRDLLEKGEGFWQRYPFEVSPPTDDRPFFFHFFRWAQTPYILKMMGKTWQPFGGSGYLVLVIFLALTVLASGVLILLPLRLAPLPSGAVPGRVRLAVFLYFGLLGLGYLFVEIPLLQRFILFLDHPIYAFAAVLSSLLVFSGIGSALSARLPWKASLAVTALLLLLYPIGLRAMFSLFLGLPLTLRLLITGLVLAPLGFFMGVPFPRGTREVGVRWPSLIPWAWAVNGSLSVVASVAAMMLALSFGFRWVLLAGSLVYLGALGTVAFLLESHREHGEQLRKF